MKFGIRTPSLKKRIAARTSPARFVRHSLGFKAPKGWGWLTNPKKAAYNRVYNKTTVGCAVPLVIALVICFSAVLFAGQVYVKQYTRKDGTVVSGHYRNTRGSGPASSHSNHQHAVDSNSGVTTLEIIKMRESSPKAEPKPRSEYDKAMDVFKKQRGWLPPTGKERPGND